MAKRLKYLSIKTLNGGPNRFIKNPMRKNLNDRLQIEASRNGKKEICAAPAATVNTLYGMGVKPAVNTAQNAFSSKTVETRWIQ